MEWSWGAFLIGLVVGWLATLVVYTVALGLCQAAARQDPE